MMRLLMKVALVVGVALALSAPAQADSATFTINVPNSGLSGTPGPYATVTLTLVTSNQGSTTCSVAAPCINVSVTMLGSFTYFGVGSGAFGMNIAGSATGVSVTNLTSNLSPSGLSWTAGAGNMDGFGDFDIIINDGTPNSGHTSMSFTLSRSGGFSSVNNAVEASCGGEFCGAHFVIHVSPGPGIPTGFAGDTGTKVPEPGTMSLLGLGLAGVAGAILRRRLVS